MKIVRFSLSLLLIVATSLPSTLPMWETAHAQTIINVDANKPGLQVYEGTPLLMNWIKNDGELPPATDEERMPELFRSYPTITAFLSDVRRLKSEFMPLSIGKTITQRGVTLSLENPREGDVLIESESFMVTETLLRDPTAHPKLQTIRRLAVIDKTTGEKILARSTSRGSSLQVAVGRRAMCLSVRSVMALSSCNPTVCALHGR